MNVVSVQENIIFPGTKQLPGEPGAKK